MYYASFTSSPIITTTAFEATPTISSHYSSYNSVTNRLMGDIDIDLRIKKINVGIDTIVIDGKIKLDELRDTVFYTNPLQKAYYFKQYIPARHLLHDSLNGILEIFKINLIDAAKEAGHKIAKDIINNRFMNDISVTIPIKDSSFNVPLSQIISCSSNDSIIIDWSLVRNEVKKYKKYLFQQKTKTINIIKSITRAKIKLEDAYKYWGISNYKGFFNMSEDDINKEIKALSLLKKIIKDDEFREYLHKKYIDVVHINNTKIYRVHRDSKIEVIDIKNNKIVERLCTHLTNNFNYPKTDEVIAKILLARNDVERLLEESNKYVV